jgi:hypothetical protein
MVQIPAILIPEVLTSNGLSAIQNPDQKAGPFYYKEKYSDFFSIKQSRLVLALLLCGFSGVI